MKTKYQINNHDITQARAFELLDYDPETGVFRWKHSRGKVRAGSEAGHVQAGYRKVTIDKLQIKLHRLAWFMTKGCWPSGQIDHIDGDKLNNAIHNLRDVPMSINMQNRYAQRKKSGLPQGVRKRGDGKFVCSIQIGIYATPEEAGAAYMRAKIMIHDGCNHLAT